MWFEVDWNVIERGINVTQMWFIRKKLIQSWLSSERNQRDSNLTKGELLDIGTELNVILIIIKSDSEPRGEPRGELLLIQTCSKWFKID